MVGLYPNRPHQEGIDIMKTFLNEGSDKPISRASLCRLAKIIAKDNYFELDDEIFHESLGTAARTKFVPSYVNIFMTGLQ